MHVFLFLIHRGTDAHRQYKRMAAAIRAAGDPPAPIQGTEGTADRKRTAEVAPITDSRG